MLSFLESIKQLEKVRRGFLTDPNPPYAWRDKYLEIITKIMEAEELIKELNKNV